MRIVLITPPMTQLNTPYPATAYLTAFLRSRGFPDTHQRDGSLEIALRLFSKAGLIRVRDALPKRSKSASVQFFRENFDAYANAIEPVVRFLQGQDSSLAHRLVRETLLPQGPRFLSLDEPGNPTLERFGDLGIHDLAKHYASLFIDDIADVIRDGVDERFALSRYAEQIAASQISFTPLLEAVESPTPTLIDTLIDEWTTELLLELKPNVIALSTPFPGNVLAALRIARVTKTVTKPWDSPTRVIWGGGYVNTELRELSDPRVFQWVDAIFYDDGEAPLLAYLKNPTHLHRAKTRVNHQVIDHVRTEVHDVPQKELPAPTYDGLQLDRALHLLEMPNPVSRLWSDGHWNKLTLAHGCYWKKCSFCDVTLDYIGRYDPVSADVTVNRMIALMKETGKSGFHFVDEAVPPALLKNLSLRLLERGVTASWWGNLRFDRAFTPELSRLMAQAGCIAVTGGLEVASDRLLGLMNKGVTIEQVARVTHAFTQSGILVHAYLMYGFPTQTVQETVDALEVVRQLFAADCLQSAFWHRFAATTHSPVGKTPAAFGVTLKDPRILTPREGLFAINDLAFQDPTPTPHDALGLGLKKALYNYMMGLGLDEDVRVWFETVTVPRTTVPKNRIQKALKNSKD